MSEGFLPRPSSPGVQAAARALPTNTMRPHGLARSMGLTFDNKTSRRSIGPGRLHHRVASRFLHDAAGGRSQIREASDASGSVSITRQLSREVAGRNSGSQQMPARRNCGPLSTRGSL